MQQQQQAQIGSYRFAIHYTSRQKLWHAALEQCQWDGHFSLVFRTEQINNGELAFKKLVQYGNELGYANELRTSPVVWLKDKVVMTTNK